MPTIPCLLVSLFLSCCPSAKRGERFLTFSKFF
jgi:hypothetical protein